MIKTLNPLPALLLCMATFLFSCNNDDIDTNVSVFTEEIVFTSGEQAIMTGRVLAQGEVAVEDHGFQIDTDENFSDPIVISLGEKSIPGRFIGETNGLDIHLDYYCRAFILTKGETKTGNVLPFSTLSPKAIDFSPKEGKQNTKLTLEGINLTADTKIIWNNERLLTPDNIISETFVEFKVPALDNDPTINLKLISQGDTSEFSEPFEYIIGEWNEEATLDNSFKSQRHVYFENTENFIYGLGLVQGLLSPQFQLLNKKSLQRTPIAFPGQPVDGAFFNASYFGGGSTIKVAFPTQTIPLSTEFWKYEDQGFVRLQDAPIALYKAVTLMADNKIYLYGGEVSGRDRSYEVHVYDIGTDTWDPVFTVSPISPLNSYPFFHLNGYNYFVTETGETYRHDYTNDEWTRVAQFPTQPKEYGVSVLLNGMAYAGMQESDRRFYVYRPWNDSWRTKESLPNNLIFFTMGGWTNDNNIFVIRTQASNPTNKVLWRFDPDGF